jgi:hypothetical protein
MRTIRDAIARFRAADQLDAPISPREYLARALVAAANRETDPAQSSQLRKEALTLYGKTSLKPAVVWLDANALPPGFVSDQMSAYM